MSEELTGPAAVLDELLDKVTDAFVDAKEPPRANALKRLRGYLTHVQGSEELQEEAAMLQALKDAPRAPGFGSYGPAIDGALRKARKELGGE